MAMTLQPVIAQQQGLSAAGWTLMIGCIGLVCGLLVFCFFRVLTTPSATQHMHAPLDIDTHDTDT